MSRLDSGFVLPLLIGLKNQVQSKSLMSFHPEERLRLVDGKLTAGIWIVCWPSDIYENISSIFELLPADHVNVHSRGLYNRAAITRVEKLLKVDSYWARIRQDLLQAYASRSGKDLAATNR